MKVQRVPLHRETQQRSPYTRRKCVYVPINKLHLIKKQDVSQVNEERRNSVVSQAPEKKKNGKQEPPTSIPAISPTTNADPQVKLQMIESRTVVMDARKTYVPFCKDEVHYSDDHATLTLLYPEPGYSERFLILGPKIVGDYSPVVDLRETTQMMVQYCIPPEFAEDFGDTKVGTLRQIIKACNRKSLTDLKIAMENFNDKILKVQHHMKHNGASIPNTMDLDLISHIFEQSYARAVAPVSHKLSKSRGFSNTVYGEVNSNLVNEFIQVTNLQSHHTFLDMGSGIGNVVLQVAGQCGATSYGVEIMSHLHEIGVKQQGEFECRMQAYGKKCGQIVLRNNDFLIDELTDEVLKKADVIFINNYIFDAELMNNIMQKLLDVKDSVQIITLKSLNSVDKRVNARTAHHIRSIFNVKEYYFGQGFVSWMAEGGSYYVHTIDRSSIKQFAE